MKIILELVGSPTRPHSFFVANRTWLLATPSAFLSFTRGRDRCPFCVFIDCLCFNEPRWHLFTHAGLPELKRIRPRLGLIPLPCHSQPGGIYVGSSGETSCNKVSQPTLAASIPVKVLQGVSKRGSKLLVTLPSARDNQPRGCYPQTVQSWPLVIHPSYSSRCAGCSDFGQFR